LLTNAGFRHAFFTREGGVSVGPYATLNFAYSVGDVAEHVDENFALAASALGVARERLYFLSQVHGANVVELAGSETRSDVTLREADALVSGSPEVACGVRTADCLPILMGDTLTGRVAAIHAGWRGLVARVIDRAAESLGGQPRDWVVAIGPHIRVDAFEVSPDVAAELQLAAKDVDCIKTGPRGRPHVDLACVAVAQLETLGVPRSHIDVLPGCTQSEPAHFYSFRRDGKVGGRHLSAIVPVRVTR
jgi:hypothetical protein